MKILVDTHIFLWMLSCPEKFHEKRRIQLESPANQIYLSSISIAELMIKQSIGKINIEFDPIEMAGILGLVLLDFTGHDAIILGDLPFHHKDPFDRMLIAQAMGNQFCLMTDDMHFKSYPCQVV